MLATRMRMSGGLATFFNIITDLGLLTNLEVCLDVGDAASYTSGQSWLDRTNNGFDFFPGVDDSVASDDPTFNGRAGGLTNNEFWSFDGGDFFRYDSANETWMQNLHKDGAIYTTAGVFYIGTGSTTQGLFSTEGANGANVGTGHHIDTSDRLVVLLSRGTTSQTLHTSTATFSTGTFVFFAVSLDEPAGGTASTVDINGTQETFDGTYTSPSAANATFTLEVASRGNAVSPLSNNSRLACIAFWEGTALTGANLTSIRTEIMTRFP